MMKKIFKISIIILVVTLSACEEETELFTSGELIGREIMKVVNENDITKATIWEWDIVCFDQCGRYEPQQTNVSFRIEAGYVLVNYRLYYNLERLQKWSIVDSQGDKILYLYFK
jgi:hypothetical protein